MEVALNFWSSWVLGFLDCAISAGTLPDSMRSSLRSQPKTLKQVLVLPQQLSEWELRGAEFVAAEGAGLRQQEVRRRGWLCWRRSGSRVPGGIRVFPVFGPQAPPSSRSRTAAVKLRSHARRFRAGANPGKASPADRLLSCLGWAAGPRACLVGGKASDRVGGRRTQAVREGRDDRTVHPGRLARSLRTVHLCNVHLEVKLAVLIVLDWGRFCSYEVLSGKRQSIGKL